MSIVFLTVVTILCAYGITAALVPALLFFLYSTAPRMLARNGEPRLAFKAINLLVWSLCAALGGILIGFVTQWHPVVVAFGFGCVLFAAILSVAIDSIGKTSLNYEVAVGACAAACAIGGTLLMQWLHLHIAVAP